jgi:signal transduction histidine kinase
MDKDLLTIRWVTFVAFVSVAALYLFPRIETGAASLLSAALLIVLAAAFLTWSLEASLRYLVRRLSPQIESPGSAREKETAALRHLHSATAQQELPALLADLLETLRPAVGAEMAFFWLPDGLPGGLAAPVLLPAEQDSDDAPAASFTPGFLAGIWQSVSASTDPLALENLTFSRGRTRPALLAVPLAWRDEPPVGLLLLGSHAALDLDERQVLLVQTLAGEAALILQNARLMVRVEYQAVMEERARLAREIHDGLAQTLAFLKIQAAQMHYFLQQGKLDRLEETLVSSRQTLGEAYQEARQAIDNLRLLPETSTRDWLLHLARDFESATGLSVETSMVGLAHELPPTVQAQLIRIVQEALANVRKHAQAERVKVSAIEQGGSLLIEVADDGLGFDPQQAGVEAHYGLTGMRERADMIGALITVEGRPGAGTTVRLQLPLGTREKP